MRNSSNCQNENRTMKNIVLFLKCVYLLTINICSLLHNVYNNNALFVRKSFGAAANQRAQNSYRRDSTEDKRYFYPFSLLQRSGRQYTTYYNDWFYLVLLFVDIDECSEEPSNECDVNAECTNTEGSYTCKCRDGYLGDGKNCSRNNYDSKFN